MTLLKKKTNRSRIFPGTEWETILPGEAGFDSKKLDGAKGWLDDGVGSGRYRIVIVRSGCIVAEWNHGFYSKKRFPLMASAKSVFLRAFHSISQPSHVNRKNVTVRNIHLPLASAAKSVFSCILGIAIQEGKIPTADARIADFYPEAMDVSEGEGPKPGRHVISKRP